MGDEKIIKNVPRYDKVQIVQSDLRQPRLTEEGFLMFDARATRAGIFLYSDGKGGVRREFRPPSEVGDPESLATLANKPFTDRHPKRFVDSNNTDAIAGTIGPNVIWEQDFEDGFVRVTVVAHRAETVAAILSGKRDEVSCGYRADLEMTPGIFVDHAGVSHEYDAIQRNIRYNHMAAVEEGRAGPKARAKTFDEKNIEDRFNEMKKRFAISDIAKALGKKEYDVAEMMKRQLSEDEMLEIVRALGKKTKKKKDTSMGIRIDGKTYDVDEHAPMQRAIEDLETDRNRSESARKDAAESLEKGRQLYAKLQEERDELQKTFDQLSAKADALEKEVDQLKADNDELLKSNPSDDELLALAQDRANLVAKADQYDIDSEGLSNEELKREIVRRDLKPADESRLDSVDYVNAGYDLILAREDGDKKTPAKKAGQKIAATKKVNDANDDDEFDLLATWQKIDQKVADAYEN